MLTLFKWITVTTPVPVWIVTFGLILLWWALSWLLMKMVKSWKIRRDPVIILAQRILFLVGAILILDVTLVPIVLIAFHGIAFYTLLICSGTALFYVILVNDRDKPEDREIPRYPRKRRRDEDIFA